MEKYHPIDCDEAWKNAQQKVDEGLKKGWLSKKEAASVLNGARKAYRDQHLNKALNRRGRLKNENYN